MGMLARIFLRLGGGGNSRGLYNFKTAHAQATKNKRNLGKNLANNYYKPCDKRKNIGKILYGNLGKNYYGYLVRESW